MALSNEDKKDVKNAYGKALANRVSKVTRDKQYTKSTGGGGHVGDIKKSFAEHAKSKALSKKSLSYRQEERHERNKAKKEGKHFSEGLGFGI